MHMAAVAGLEAWFTPMAWMLFKTCPAAFTSVTHGVCEPAAAAAHLTPRVAVLSEVRTCPLLPAGRRFGAEDPRTIRSPMVVVGSTIPPVPVPVAAIDTS